jgi:hypothetical protein
MIVDLPLFCGATAAVLLYYVVSQIAAGQRRSLLRHLPAALGLGIGLAVNNARAVVEGLRQRGGVFERTPKYRIEATGQGWDRRRYRARPDLSVITEGLFALYFTLSALLAWALGMWTSLPFLALFFYGYWSIFLWTLLAGRWISRRPRRAQGVAAAAARR